MKLILPIIFFYVTCIFGNIYAQTISVVNIQFLIDSNPQYNSILTNIEIDQLKYLKNFETKENDLKKKLKIIEDSKLILNENEINLQINEYNKELSNLRIRVEEFNSHYQNQIYTIRESILEEIINSRTENSLYEFASLEKQRKKQGKERLNKYFSRIP